jgi:hypothetical protein
VEKKWVLGLAAFIVIGGGAGIWFYLAGRHPAPAAAPVSAAAPSAVTPAEPAIAHPLPGEGASASSLPELSASDIAFGSALGGLVGPSAVQKYFAPENLIRRVVVTVDNLPRQKVSMDKRAVVAVPGGFEVTGDELHATLSPGNEARYRPLVAIIRNLDMHEVAKVYIHFYPLFQRAYTDLGYPTGYFNDRLIAVIDELLATPQPAGPIELVRPNVMYQFADPGLEARPAGQKVLLRMGAENAAVIKSKLTELRAALTASPPQRP